MESRRLLTAGAAQVGIKEIATSGGVELLIIGTNQADAITINDNGTGNAGNITVLLGNGTTYTSRAQFPRSRWKEKAGTTRSPTISRAGAVTAPPRSWCNIGAGNDQFRGDIAGAIDNPTGLELEVFGDTGNDNMSIVQTGRRSKEPSFPIWKAMPAVTR